MMLVVRAVIFGNGGFGDGPRHLIFRSLRRKRFVYWRRKIGDESGHRDVVEEEIESWVYDTSFWCSTE